MRCACPNATLSLPDPGTMWMQQLALGCKRCCGRGRGFAFSWFYLHIEGVADTGQLASKCCQDKTVSPLFVMGRPLLKML